MPIIRCPICDEIGVFPDAEDESARPQPKGCLYDESALGCEAPAWYVAYTKPQAEKQAVVELKRQGYPVFFPVTRVRKRFKRPNKPTFTVREIERPHFPGYVFIGLLRGRGLYDANMQPSVSTILYVNGEPLRVPGNVVTRLMEVCDEDGVVGFEDRAGLGGFTGRPGENVRFLADSPFYGFVATVASITGYDKTGTVSVWLDLLGAKREVPVSAESLAVLRTASKP